MHNMHGKNNMRTSLWEILIAGKWNEENEVYSLVFEKKMPRIQEIDATVLCLL